MQLEIKHCKLIILVLAIIVLILSIIMIKTKNERFSVCIDSLDRSFDGLRCLPSNDFQKKCVQYTLDNGTVFPSYAEQACKQGDTPIMSVGL